MQETEERRRRRLRLIMGFADCAPRTNLNDEQQELLAGLRERFAEAVYGKENTRAHRANLLAFYDSLPEIRNSLTRTVFAPDKATENDIARIQEACERFDPGVFDADCVLHHKIS